MAALLERPRPFAPQDGYFASRATRIAARRAVGTHDAMAWHARGVRVVVHDIPYRPIRVRPAGAPRDLLICHRTPTRDLGDDRVYFFGEEFWRMLWHGHFIIVQKNDREIIPVKLVLVVR